MVDGKRNEVAIEIEAMLTKAKAPLANKCYIYKVPQEIHKLNQDAYTPKVVSIDPFHHGSPTLQNAEREKQIFLRKFIQRTNTDLDNLVRSVEGLEPDVRYCYSENITLRKEELVKIILVDAGFILELLIWRALRDWNRDELLSLNSWLFCLVVEDLLLLENQLPFFVLDKLLKLAPPASVPKSLLELSFHMFRTFNFQKIASQSVTITPHHFTDLLRTFYLQPQSDRGGIRPERREELLYSVIDLHEAGVKLKANTQEYQCLLELKFSSPVLEIPQLRLYDSSEMLFRNMVALEQCIYPYEPYITDYVIILDYLINKEKDVDVLVQKGILKNWFGDNNDVAKLVNGLVKNIVHGDFSPNYQNICKGLNAFCENDWNNNEIIARLLGRLLLPLLQL